MSNYPSGYSEPPTIDELVNEGATNAFQFVLDNRIKFRHKGDKNTELWWTPDSKHSGKCIASLVGFMSNHESDFKACEDCGAEASELAEHDDEMLCASCIRKDNIRQMEEMDDVSNLMGG